MNNIKKLLFKIKKSQDGLQKLLLIGFLILILVTISLGKPYYIVGEVFFGNVPLLYNVKLAEFFYYRASHPYIGEPAPYAFHQLSRTAFIQGDLIAALDYAKKELEVYPDHIATYYIIGLTYGYLGDERSAIASFAQYVASHPSTWAGRNDMAWLQFRIGDIDGALKTIEPAYSLYPENPWVLNTYGVLLMNKGEYVKAKEIFTQGSLRVQSLSEDDWGRAYPGNDPRIYSTGLSAMQKSFRDNLNLVEMKIRANKSNTVNSKQ